MMHQPLRRGTLGTDPAERLERALILAQAFEGQLSRLFRCFQSWAIVPRKPYRYKMRTQRNGMKIKALCARQGKSSAMYANKNDGKPWSESDLQDLKVSIEAGLTVAETATALSREGSFEDVIKTAKAHGWEFRHLSQIPDDRQERTRGPK
jgi:hypothetical protein